MNRGEEDYLKAIYELEQHYSNQLISNQQLMTKLGHTNQSVIEMIKKLQGKDLLEYQPYKGVRLTQQGKGQAIRLIRAHRLWELFLTEKLGLNWSEVHEEAELLEHVTSLRVNEKLYHYLGEPVCCPHGYPIPSLNGEEESYDYCSLLDVPLNEFFQIQLIVDN